MAKTPKTTPEERERVLANIERLRKFAEERLAKSERERAEKARGQKAG